MSTTTSLLLLSWVAIVLLALAVGGLTAQIRTMNQASLLARSTKRAVSIGFLQTLDGPLTGPYVALFTRGACPGCEAVLPAVANEFGHLDRGVRVFIVSDVQNEYPSAGGPMLQWITDPDAASRFGIPAFPWLLAIDDRGEVIDDGVVPSPVNAVARIYANSMRR